MDPIISKKIEEFFTKFKNQKYKKGEILVRADDDPSGIFYLKEGLVKEYGISRKGEELVVNIFKPFAFFPMSWGINGTPNSYFFEAMTDLNIWRAPRDETVKFIKQNPDVLYDLLCRVYRGTDGIITRMTYLMAGNAYARLVSEIVVQARRFGKEKNSAFEVQISEMDLAAQSGMTRETISREIKILKNKGLVSFEKNILSVLNITKLEKELEGGV